MAKRTIKTIRNFFMGNTLLREIYFNWKIRINKKIDLLLFEIINLFWLFFGGLHFNFHAGVHLFDFVAEHFVQNFVSALACAMACVDSLHVQIAEAFGECFHAVVGCAEQVKSAEDGVNWLAGECRFDFLDDVVGTAVAATVHDEQAFGCVED